MILVIFDNHILGYDAFKKVCAGIKWENQEEDEKKVPNIKLSMVDSIGDLVLIFGLNLSIGSPYYQGGRIWLNFRLSKYFKLRWYSWESRTPLTKLSAQSFCTGSDDPAEQWISALSKSGWSGLNPDDPDLGFLWAPGSARPDDPAVQRMIRT